MQDKVYLKTDLLHEDDKNLPEDLDEVDEEVQGVSDEVLVSTTSLVFKSLNPLTFFEN